MYNNNNNTKKAVDFYKEWHTEDGLKNLNENDVRIGMGATGGMEKSFIILII